LYIVCAILKNGFLPILNLSRRNETFPVLADHPCLNGLRLRENNQEKKAQIMQYQLRVLVKCEGNIEVGAIALDFVTRRGRYLPMKYIDHRGSYRYGLVGLKVNRSVIPRLRQIFYHVI